MADWIRRVAAVGEHVVECFEASDGLVLAEGAEQVGKFVLWDFELAHGFCERDENRVTRSSRVAGVEFGLPLIEERERGGGVADFVAEIVGNAAVGVDVNEVLAQAARKKPCGDGK